MKEQLDIVLGDELQKSKNWSKWSFCSFWEFPDHDVLLAPTKQFAEKLVPGFTNNHYFHCTMDVDFYEEKAKRKCAPLKIINILY